MGLELHVHVLGIVRLEGGSLEQPVIHKVVMVLELHVPTHVIQEVPYLVPHAIFHKVHPILIHVLLGAPCQVLHAHFLHQEARSMDVPMVEHNQTESAYYPQDNVYLDVV